MSTPTDWVKAGFTKPTSPEWEEHNRVGDVSTGRAFKGTQNIPNYVLLDEVDANTLYIGESKPGTDTASALWRIRKLLTTGTVTSIQFADGDDLFDNIWADRTSLNYS